MFYNVSKYLRIADWHDSKVPFMLSIALFFNIYMQSSMSYLETYYAFGAYYLYVSMFLAFSYVINDYTDIDIDKRAGKSKVMHSLPTSLIFITMFLMVFIGVGPMLIIVHKKLLYLIYTFFLYITGAAYSVHKLLRFKERGMIGLIECSIAQRCLPLIPLMFIFQVDYLFFILFLLLSFINGVRYILIHQVIDYENDIKTGVKTYVSSGHNRFRTEIKAAFIIECLIFLVIFIKLFINHTYLLPILCMYVVFEKIIAIVVTKYMNTELFYSFLAVPLESLYNVLFPFILAVILFITHKGYVGILIFIVFLCFKCFMGKVAFISVYAKSILIKNKY